MLGLFSRKTVENIIERKDKEIKAAALGAVSRNVFTNTIVFAKWNQSDPTEAFTSSDQIYSVINKIAETTGLIPGYVYEVKSDVVRLKAATSRQFYTTKAIIDIGNLQRKALQDIADDDWYAELFQRPNPYQSWTEFDTLGKIYYLLHGEAVCYKVRIGEGVNAGKTQQMYWLPPYMIELTLSGSFPRSIEAYTFRFNGQAVIDQEPPENFIHIRKGNPVITNTGDEFRGLSPLQPFGMQRELMKQLDTRTATQVKNGALPGVMFDKTPNDGDEETQTQYNTKRKAITDFMRNPDNSGMPYYTTGEVEYIATGLKLADLDVAKLIDISFKRLCNVYKVSTILFNSDVAATESNVQEQIKQMYTNACLPLAYTFRDAYNNQLLNEVNDKKRFYDIDISAVTELQDDIGELMKIFSDSPGGFTLNEIRGAVKFDSRDEPYMNLPVMRQGWVAAETLQLEEPLLQEPDANIALRI